MAQSFRWLLYAAVLTTLFSAVPAVAQNVEMGSTYYSLDDLVTRSVSQYRDTRVVIERTAPGVLEAVLTRPDGTEVGWVRADEYSGRVEIRSKSLAQGTLQVVQGLPFGRITSDWMATQAYSLRLDLGILGSAEPFGDHLEWDGYLIRPRGVILGPQAAKHHVERVRHDELKITTEFGRLVAESVKTSTKAEARARPGGGVAVASFTTRFFDAETGQNLGLARKFNTDKVFVWDFPGISSGWVSADRVPGGWAFDHNMAWANIQSFAFFSLRRDGETMLGERLAMTPSHPADPAPGWEVSPAVALLGQSPPSLFQKSGTCDKEPDGCTGLHWLDGTIYRECCDAHDKCYYRNDEPCCTAWSWIFLDPRWRCIQCNLEVLWCFLTAGGGGPGGGGGGGGGGSSCTVSGAQWCPAECFSCIRVY